MYVQALQKLAVDHLKDAALLVVLEVIQVFTMRGAIDVDDLILNMTGALIGFKLWKSRLGQKVYSYDFN